MNPPGTPLARDLVLAGGGHSHALLLRMAGMKPVEGVRLTLVSDTASAPYSGMLPGHVAGAYSHDETHIDLRKLAGWAGARFIEGSVAGVDPTEKRLLLEGRPSIRYDLLSINTGSTPQALHVPGAAEHAVAAKPVGQFLEVWEQFASDPSSEGMIVVGAGAGGVELALSARTRLGPEIPIRVVQRADRILPTHNDRVRGLFEKVLAEREIEVLLGDAVTEVKSNGVTLDSGNSVSGELVVWVTDASAPTWIADSGLATDDRGFLHVSQKLQSLSHPDIFGAGDVATMEEDPRPKSGVFAVRMAKPLWKNVRRHLQGRPLSVFRPQKNFLSLIGTGEGEAIASRGGMANRASWLWGWKDRIDRKFMEKFENLPEMDETQAAPTSTNASSGNQSVEGLEELRRHATMRCLGCAAKVGAPVLSRALTRLRADFDKEGLFAADEGPEDAYVTQIPTGSSLIQTVDYMPALVTDPWLFGRITALHCLSDLFAMGATAESILALVIVPFAAEDIVEEDVYQALSGVVHELEKLGVALGGGHTAEGDQLALGLTCNGHAPDHLILKKAGLRKGDHLILTKAIGTGTIFATDMRGKAPRGAVDAALRSMTRPNADAGHILRAHGAEGCTDVTGFGLVGHLVEMLRAAGLSASLQADAIPLLKGAAQCAADGQLSSLHAQNARAVSVVENPPTPGTEPEGWPLFFDPQTSGGLLAGVSEDQVEACLAALHEAGDFAATRIGVVGSPKEEVALIKLVDSI